LSERKEQILQTAIEIIADEGYSSLTMRALARASGLKLGALQHHFRTWEDMVRALVTHIAGHYRKSFDAIQVGGAPTVRDCALFLLSEPATDAKLSDRLWPQLWAMQQVEPLVADLLDDVYSEFLTIFEKALALEGSEAPRAEALALLSMLEAGSLFTGSGRRWESDRADVNAVVMKFIDARYGEKL